MQIDTVVEIYKRMSRASMRSDRDPAAVRLIAVTKEVDPALIDEAIGFGLREFGENRVQAAKEKIPIVTAGSPDSPLVWHLIGHLQKNKARTAVELFDLIHSVDSYELAAVLDRIAREAAKTQRILLQVKLSEEESKHGIPPGEIQDIIDRVSRLGSLRLEGLMTIPPYLEDPQEVRPFFATLAGIRDEAVSRGHVLPELSMGMSHDFEIAIEEGATMVRVGTAIFGERRKK